MNSLFIFVDTERADQYLNSLVYCVLRRDVRRVTFVHIRGLMSSGSDNHGLSSRVLGRVQSQLEALSDHGEYLISTGERKGQRIALEEEYGSHKAQLVRMYYAKCRELPVFYANEDIEYSQLRAYLQRVTRMRSSVFVDVTAIRKRYLGDLVAAGLVEGLSGLYTFDIIRPLDFERPWSMLIHELEEGGVSAYSYTNLLDTEVYKSCGRSVVVRSLRFRMALSGSLLAVVIACLVFWLIGPNSVATQVFFYLSSGASILSLVFVFFVPRSR